MRDKAESASIAIRKTGLAQQQSRAKKRARSSRLTRRLPIQAPLRAWCTPLRQVSGTMLGTLNRLSRIQRASPCASAQYSRSASSLARRGDDHLCIHGFGDCSLAPGSQQLSSPLPDVDDPVDFPVQDLIDVVHVMNMERTQGKHNLPHLRFAYNWAQRLKDQQDAVLRSGSPLRLSLSSPRLSSSWGPPIAPMSPTMSPSGSQQGRPSSSADTSSSSDSDKRTSSSHAGEIARCGPSLPT